MASGIKTCQNCKQEFGIQPDDLIFYERFNVPEPTWCPQCRMVRRLMFRNERSLYKRTCDLCHQDKVMMYSSDTPFPVYCKECWWSDNWDPKTYAREYDFTKTFFDQFRDLLHAVPRVGVVQQGNNVNSEYANRVTDNRNSYLVYGSTRTENCRYGVWFNDAKESLDCYNVRKSEYCFESVDCMSCYKLAFSQECNNCADSWFLYNCTNCQSCFGCVNLRNKTYCLFNEQLTKEEYQKRVGQFMLSSRIFLEGLKKRWEEIKTQAIVPALVTHHSENVSGNWIENSKSLFHSFSCYNIEEGKYLESVFDAKDVMDYCYWGNQSEQVYEAINIGIQSAGVRFSSECWNQAINFDYCLNCHSSHDLFGCIGLRSSEFCILNKQYSKEDFEKMKERIISHTKEKQYTDSKGRTYSYGEFLPPEFSPHAYNETIAQEFFPLTKKEVLEYGYGWREPEARNYQITLKASSLPDSSKDVPESLTKEVIECQHAALLAGGCNHQCTTAFRILPQDLEIYQKANLPLPVLCPNCRHYGRLSQRNPMKLRPGSCMCSGNVAENTIYKNVSAHFHGAEHCPNTFETSYPAQDNRVIYCLKCYNAEVV